MSGFSMSSNSTQYVLVPIRAWSQGQPYNPTGLLVNMAFVTGTGPPASGQWNPASWAWTSGNDSQYAIQCLVGPQNSGVSLSIGTYSVWVQIIGSPEEPVISAGSLTITP